MTVKAAPQSESNAMIERLLAQDDDAQRQRMVREDPSFDWDAIVNTLAKRVWQEVRVDTARAQRQADIAISVAEVIGNHLSLGKSYRAKANALYAVDQPAAAIDAHNRAAEEFEQAGDENELARALSGAIQPLLLLGRYDEALAAGDRARAIFARAGNLRRLARLEINIGNIYHRQDRFAEALACYEHAYPQLLADDDAEGLAAVLSN